MVRLVRLTRLNELLKTTGNLVNEIETQIETGKKPIECRSFNLIVAFIHNSNAKVVTASNVPESEKVTKIKLCRKISGTGCKIYSDDLVITGTSNFHKLNQII